MRRTALSCVLHRSLEQRSPEAQAASLGNDIKLLEVGVERARVSDGRKRSWANPPGSSPAKRIVTSPLSMRGPARSAIT
jgi:hypothetical protein